MEISMGVSPGTPEWPAGSCSPSSTADSREGKISGTWGGTPDWPTPWSSPSSTTTRWEGSGVGDSIRSSRLTSTRLGLGGTGDMETSPPPLGGSGAGTGGALPSGLSIQSARGQRPFPPARPGCARRNAAHTLAASSKSGDGRTGRERHRRRAARLWAVVAGGSSRGESAGGCSPCSCDSRTRAPLLPCRLIVAWTDRGQRDHKKMKKDR